MSGEVNKPQQLPPPTLGQVFYNTANKFAMIGAMTNASVFGGCYIGYPIPGCFPIAGLDADDIAIRMMPPPPAQNTIFNGTTTGSAFSDIPNFGNWFNTTPTTNPTGTTAAPDGTKPSYLSAEQKQKTTNTSEVFSKIDSAKWAEMREKEAEIAKKHDEWSKATGTEKNAKAKELRALHQEYDKLDRELGGGSALSHRYGITDRTFYTNIDDETELSSIKDINGEIEQAQKELADTDEDYGKLLAEKDSAAAQLRKELGVFVTITDDMAKERMSAESREALEALTKQRAEKISEIESKIKELNELIKKAGKDKDKYSITGDKIEDAKGEKPAEKSKDAKPAELPKPTPQGGGEPKISDLFKDDGNPDEMAVDFFVDKIAKSSNGKSDYTTSVRARVSENISKNIEKKEDKVNFKEDEFIEYVKTIKDPKEMELLVKAYDAIFGKDEFSKVFKEKLGFDWQNCEKLLKITEKEGFEATHKKLLEADEKHEQAIKKLEEILTKHNLIRDYDEDKKTYVICPEDTYNKLNEEDKKAVNDACTELESQEQNLDNMTTEYESFIKK